MLVLLSTLLVFGLGFVVLPFGTSWYEIPKVIVGLVSIAVICGGFFWRPDLVKKVKLPKFALCLLAGLFVLSIFDLLFLHTTQMFWGNAFRMQGVFLLWALLAFAVVSPYLVDIKKAGPWMTPTLCGLLLAAVFGVTDAVGRSVGLVGEANALGAYAVFLFSFAQGRFKVFALPIALAVIFFSGSRSALVGVVVSGVVVFLAARIGLKKASMLSFIILFASLVLPFLNQRQDFDDRVVIWQTAFQAGREKPLLGWGVGNVEVGLEHAAHSIQTSLRYQYVDSSHNVFLDWWVQGGVVGMMLFTTLVLTAVKGLIQQNKVLHVAALSGILSVMLFNPVSVAVLVPFWWLIGVGLQRTTR